MSLHQDTKPTSRRELAETLRRNSELSAEESIQLVDRLFAALGHRPKPSTSPVREQQPLPQVEIAHERVG